MFFLFHGAFMAILSTILLITGIAGVALGCAIFLSWLVQMWNQTKKKG